MIEFLENVIHKVELVFRIVFIVFNEKVGIIDISFLFEVYEDLW